MVVWKRNWWAWIRTSTNGEGVDSVMEKRVISMGNFVDRALNGVWGDTVHNNERRRNDKRTRVVSEDHTRKERQWNWTFPPTSNIANEMLWTWSQTLKEFSRINVNRRKIYITRQNGSLLRIFFFFLQTVRFWSYRLMVHCNVMLYVTNENTKVNLS